MSVQPSAYYFPVAKNALDTTVSNIQSSLYEHINLILVAPFLIYVGWYSITPNDKTMPLHKNFYRILYVMGFIQLVLSLYQVYKIHKNIFLVGILACCVGIMFLIYYGMGNRPVCIASDIPTTFTPDQTSMNDKIRSATKLTEGEMKTMGALIGETRNVLDMAGSFLPANAKEYITKLMNVSTRMVENNLIYSDLKSIDDILSGIPEQTKQYKSYGVNTTNLTASTAIFQRIRSVMSPIVSSASADVESDDTFDEDDSENDTDSDVSATPTTTPTPKPAVTSNE